MSPRPVGTPNAEVAHRLTQICLGREPENDLVELIDLAGTDVPTLRLLHAWGGETTARVGRQLLQLGYAELLEERPTIRRFDVLSALPGLTDGGDELPDWRDGLTPFERQTLEVMRTVAPADGAQVPLATIARAVRVDDESVGRALASLGNARLRALPIVQVTGLTVGAVGAARLSEWAEDFLSGVLPLPLLLVNGVAGKGRASPTWNVAQVLDEAIAATSAGPERNLLPDLPTGGVLDSRTLNALRHGHGAVVRLLARVKEYYDPETGRSRLVVDDLPWPLSSSEVAERLRSLVAEGAIEGARSITSTASAVIVEFAHLVWARRTAKDLMFVGLGKVLGPLQVTYEVKLLTAWPVSPREYLERFVAFHRDRLVASLTEPRATTSDDLSNAEALAVALTLLEDIQAALRPTIDLSEEVRVLMTFMTPHHRARLASLGRLTHSYDPGFTEAQARWLSAGKKLTSRSRALAEQDFERLRDELTVKVPRRLSVDAAPVRLALERAKVRFARERRTRVDRLPQA